MIAVAEAEIGTEPVAGPASHRAEPESAMSNEKHAAQSVVAAILTRRTARSGRNDAWIPSGSGSVSSGFEATAVVITTAIASARSLDAMPIAASGFQPAGTSVATASAVSRSWA